MTIERKSTKQQGLFETIQRPGSLASFVVEQIEHLIIDKQLNPGDRLPSERELADRFGVSRTVIREAVHSLVARDLLEVQTGSGMTVRNPSTNSISRSITLLLHLDQAPLDYRNVHEVRRLLEIEIAGLAAERRTKADIEALERLVHGMDAIRNDREQLAQNDVAFHLALSKATQNKLHFVLLDSLTDVMMQVRLMGLNVPGAPEHAIEYHQLIFQRVKAGDRDAARLAMSEHIETSEEIFSKALATQDKPHTETD